MEKKEHIILVGAGIPGSLVSRITDAGKDVIVVSPEEAKKSTTLSDLIEPTVVIKAPPLLPSMTETPFLGSPKDSYITGKKLPRKKKKR